jgi:hypothetical protein
VHTGVELVAGPAPPQHTDDRLFTSYLVDVVAAMLTAPVSAETARLADEARRARPPTIRWPLTPQQGLRALGAVGPGVPTARHRARRGDRRGAAPGRAVNRY